MIFAYVYDFVSFLFEKDLKSEIKSIILYGSVASGEFDEKSDIDIFVDIWDRGKKSSIEKKIKSQLLKFEERSTRIWNPRGINNPFSIIVGKLDSIEWKNLQYDIISNGIVIYGKFEKPFNETNHTVLISFELSKCNQNEKMKLIRRLYGNESIKNKKKYRIPGMLEKYGGEKISSNSILIPIEKIKEFRTVFTEFNITPRIREIWTKK